MLTFRKYSGKAIQATAHGSFEKFLSLCKRIIILDRHPEKKEVIRLLVKAYLIGMSHFGKEIGKDSENNASSKRVQQYMDLLRTKRPLQRSPRYYAGLLNISEKHLYFASMQATGFSAKHWIDQIAILEAKSKLVDGNIKVSVIAESLGFKSETVFGRFFKQHTGLTPREYRKQNN
jgi:AraC-like DNA-binding protein